MSKQEVKKKLFWIILLNIWFLILLTFMIMETVRDSYSWWYVIIAVISLIGVDLMIFFD